MTNQTAPQNETASESTHDEPRRTRSGTGLPLGLLALVAANLVAGVMNLAMFRGNLATKEENDNAKEMNELTGKMNLIMEQKIHDTAQMVRAKELELNAREAGNENDMLFYSSSAWDRLPIDDQIAILFEIMLMTSEPMNQYMKASGASPLELNAAETKELMYHIASDPQSLSESRKAFDNFMLKVAEEKSGRDMSHPNSPQVPLKWEALHDFQQRAVDYALDKDGKIGDDIRQAARDEVLKDATHLQGMIDNYRKSSQFKEYTVDPKTLRGMKNTNGFRGTEDLKELLNTGAQGLRF